MKYSHLALIALIYISSVKAGIFGASNFDECINDGKVGRSNAELNLHSSACAKKFPVPSAIFKKSGTRVTCRFSDKSENRFFIKLKQDNKAEITNFTNIEKGDLHLLSKDLIIIRFKNKINYNISTYLKIDNRGNFTLTQEEERFFGTCTD